MHVYVANVGLRIRYTPGHTDSKEQKGKTKTEIARVTGTEVLEKHYVN